MLINPESSVAEVKEKIDALVAKHSEIESKLANSDRKLRDYAAKGLTEHFTVTRAQNLKSDGLNEVEMHLSTLVQLYSRREEKSEYVARCKKEQSDLTKKIAKLSELLASHPGLQESSESISAKNVDAILNSPGPDYKSLEELDSMIRREFPHATS